MSSVDREMLTRQIRDAVDIVDLVGSYVRLTRAGASFKGLCPFHEEKTPSFYVHPVRQFFKCHGCNVGGDVYNFVQLREKVDFVEARRILAERAGISLEAESRGGHGGPGRIDLVRANEWAQQIFRRYYEGSAGEEARAYVARRGISDAMVKAFGLGLAVNSFDALIRQAGPARMDLKLLVAAGLIKEKPGGGYYDTFRHRLMFPIADPSGRLIGFGGRTLADDPAKYLNTPSTILFDKGTSLFGLDKARERIQKAGRAIIVEGYTDCIMAHQYGFTETVATLGTAMTEAHAHTLRRYTDRVVLLFDSDAAGQRAAERGLSVALTGGLDVFLTRVPEGKDPCDYLLSAGEEGFELVLKAAVPALEFRWQQVARGFSDATSGPDRRRAIEAFLHELSAWLVRGSLDPIQKGLLLNQLSKLLSLPAEDLHRQIRAMTRESRPTPAARPAAEGTDPREAPSGEQEAYRHIVEALLNAPDLYARAAQALESASIPHADLAAVVRELIALLKSDEPFRLVDLIGRFEDPRFGTLITTMQARGERRGGYEAAIEGALDWLEGFHAVRQTRALADEIRGQLQDSGDDPAASVPPGEDDRLQALALAMSARNPHFSPTRARRRILGP
ncbi:MAG: hypothetical protein AMXMBFR13_19880 [Phycisphaerae bacterium]